MSASLIAMLISLRFTAAGVSQHELALPSGATITYVNDDTRPHQVYSPDCGGLSSLLLSPGDSFVARAPTGPRSCHFQDLLQPSESSYSGAVSIAPAPVDDWVSPNVTP
jgi:hypothetical protein